MHVRTCVDSCVASIVLFNPYDGTHIHRRLFTQPRGTCDFLNFATVQVVAIPHLWLIFIPPNCTSQVQPLDQGITYSFKARYRKWYLRWLLTQTQFDPTAMDRVVYVYICCTILHCATKMLPLQHPCFPMVHSAYGPRTHLHTVRRGGAEGNPDRAYET